MKLDNRQWEQIEKIIYSVCEYFNADVTMMEEKRGEYLIYSSARHFCWYILHYDLGLSIRLIAQRFNRSTRCINQGVAKIKFGISHQSYYRDRYNDVISKIRISSLTNI